MTSLSSIIERRGWNKVKRSNYSPVSPYKSTGRFKELVMEHEKSGTTVSVKSKTFHNDIIYRIEVDGEKVEKDVDSMKKFDLMDAEMRKVEVKA